MQLQDLPAELRLGIFEQLQRRELRSLLLTCRWLNGEIAPLFYRTCYLPYTSITPHFDGPKLLATLYKYSHLAALVHKLTVRADYTPWSSILLALQQTVNLKHLILERMNSSHDLEFHGCKFQLETLETTLNLDNTLKDFLITQTSLRAIHFRYTRFVSCPTKDPLPLTALPNLTALTAQPPTLRLLLPQRPLTHLEIAGSESDATLRLDSIWIESSIANPKLRALRVLPYPLLVDYWKDIPTFFPGLRYLNASASLPLSQSVIVEAMKRLRAIHTLVLMGAHMMNGLQTELFVKSMFGASPSLVWLVFAGREWNRALQYSMIPEASCDWSKY